MAKAKERKGGKEYGLSSVPALQEMPAPLLDYKPREPKHYRPGIGLIGCGGITEQHLRAYRKADYEVVALCDIRRKAAENRRKKFFPAAEVYTDYRELLDRDDVEVVDVATHPEERTAIIEAALDARKHVLSQKPFVLDLDEGERLAGLAEHKQVLLAVNQNGRWAPHFSYMREAVHAGHIGRLATADFQVQWDHNWVRNTVFNEIRHLVLYDFAIHWFDMAAVLFSDRRPKQVYAATAHAPGQRATPPLLAHAVAEFEDGQATWSFNANCVYGQQDRTALLGSLGTLRSEGPSLTEQTVSLYTEQGWARPALEGAWFPQGFHGTMAELLCAIEENRAPTHSARANLDSVALCFAAVASAEEGAPKTPGEVRRLPGT